jgi:hypothetical protein
MNVHSRPSTRDALTFSIVFVATFISTNALLMPFAPLEGRTAWLRAVIHHGRRRGPSIGHWSVILRLGVFG